MFHSLHENNVRFEPDPIQSSCVAHPVQTSNSCPSLSFTQNQRLSDVVTPAKHDSNSSTGCPWLSLTPETATLRRRNHHQARQQLFDWLGAYPNNAPRKLLGRRHFGRVKAKKNRTRPQMLAGAVAFVSSVSLRVFLAEVPSRLELLSPT